MFNQIFVAYLMKKNAVTQKQAKEILEEQKNTKVRIGVLAEEEKLMTAQQIERVNNMQALRNVKFGDVAVEMGYLSKEQLEYLLIKQPREHIILKQILYDKKYIKPGQFEILLGDFKSSLDIGDTEFNNLLDNDIETYISRIAGIDTDNFILREYAKLFIATVIRFIDTEVFVKKSFRAKENPDSYLFTVTVKAVGDTSVTFMVSAKDSGAAKKFAENFAKFYLDEFGEDAKDAIKEFVNCVSGLLISELSNSGKMELDLEVPKYYSEGEISVDGETVVFPFSLSIGDFYIFVKIN